MKFARFAILGLIILACGLRHTHAAEDILVADFEGADYGAWQSTGEAFGKAPARGVLPGQMAVDGFAGEGLVNSFTGGDKSTGTLTSPPFEVKRRFISFLIGGGGYSNETCMNLLVDGKVLRTAAGPNVQSGGSERLQSGGWDVSDLPGRSAVIEIVDRRTGLARIGRGTRGTRPVARRSRRPQPTLAATRKRARRARVELAPRRNLWGRSRDKPLRLCSGP